MTVLSETRRFWWSVLITGVQSYKSGLRDISWPSQHSPDFATFTRLRNQIWDKCREVHWKNVSRLRSHGLSRPRPWWGRPCRRRWRMLAIQLRAQFNRSLTDLQTIHPIIHQMDLFYWVKEPFLMIIKGPSQTIYNLIRKTVLICHWDPFKDTYVQMIYLERVCWSLFCLATCLWSLQAVWNFYGF